MAVMTMEPETMLKTAMGRIGLENKADDLLDMLDEMELDRRLEISLEQAERGEGMTLEDAERKSKEYMEYICKN